MIDMDGEPVDQKVSSTAFLPAKVADIKKPDPDLFYFGSKPPQN